MTQKKELGQFFTPKQIVDFMYDLVGFCPTWKVIDPACGEGVFLLSALQRGCATVCGIDIDKKAIEDCRSNLLGLEGSYHLFHQDGLVDIETDNLFLKTHYDLVIGNPPFNSSKYRIQDKTILRRFEWGEKEDKSDNGLQLVLFDEQVTLKKKKLRPSQAIEVLFLERFIQLAKQGGKVAIILPEGVFANTSARYVRDYLVENLTIKAIIGLPTDTFREFGTTAKTCILYLKNRKPQKDNHAFIAALDSLNNDLGERQLAKILEEFRKHENGDTVQLGMKEVR